MQLSCHVMSPYPLSRHVMSPSQAKRRPSDPYYDPSTLHIPPTWYKEAKVSEGQAQWWSFKATNFDSVLLFKMGKFYEMYEMDAYVGVDVLGLIFMKVRGIERSIDRKGGRRGGRGCRDLCVICSAHLFASHCSLSLSLSLLCRAISPTADSPR